ncbi:MAG: VCBS repeat-containing protein [Myxococcota bacterium]
MRRHARLFAALLLLGCSENTLIVQDPLNTVCEGESRTNAISECRPICTPAGADAAAVPVDETCLVPDVEVRDPWLFEVEWEIPFSAPNFGSGVTPKVGHLQDTDGDGDVDTDDVPSIALVAYDEDNQGKLLILSGADGTLQGERTGMASSAEVVLADVDLDGVTDILTITADNQVIALDAPDVGASLTMRQLWKARTPERSGWPMLTVADLEGDGVAEVITREHIFSGADGTLLTTLDSDITGISYAMPAVGDIDLDGEQEIIVGDTCFAPNGSVEWVSTVRGFIGHWSAIVNVDDDDEGEVIMIGGGEIQVLDPDGTVLETIFTDEARQPGPPCVADFDGDQRVEIAWPAGNELVAYELNGTPKWSTPISDEGGSAGCSGYDFDGDGAYEVLFADQFDLLVLDGETGGLRFQQTGHASGTVFEYPVIADVDNDRAAEVVFVSNSFTSDLDATVTVLGHAGTGWPRAGTSWGVHDFAVSNAPPDGRLPSPPPLFWLLNNSYRARPAVDTARSDLRIDLVDTCASNCDLDQGVLSIAVQVSNTGAADISEPIAVSIYAVDGGIRELLHTESLPEGIPGGGALPSFTFDVPVELIGPSGLLIRVDDPGDDPTGLIGECDEANNTLRLEDLPCR